MPVLNIEGQSVTVDEGFLKLSPAEQNATVDHIANELKMRSVKVPDVVIVHQGDGTDVAYGQNGQPAAAASRLVSGVSTPDQEQQAALTADVLKQRVTGGGLGKPMIMGVPLASIFQGVSANGGDEVVSVLKGALDAARGGSFTDSYNRAQELQRQAIDQAKRENPVGSMVGEIGGALTTAPFMPAGAGMLRGAASGAAYGGASGFLSGNGTSDRLERGLGGAIVGGTLGGALGSLGGLAPRGGGGGAPNPVVEAGDRLGVPVPQFIATDNKVTQMGAQALKQSPIGGNRVVTAAEAFKGNVGQAAENTAAGMGAGNVIKAGDAAKGGIEDFISAQVPAKAKTLYDKVDALVNPNVAVPLSETRSTVADILTRRQAAALPSTGSAVDAVTEAIKRPGLTYSGLKDLRTAIGEMVDTGILPPGVSKSELKRIYEALSSDLGTTVKTAGGQPAYKAWQQANTWYAAASKRREDLAKIIGRDASASAEKTYSKIISMTQSGAKGDERALLQVKRTLQPSEWSEIGSSVLSNIGRDPAGAFSTDRFVTAWGKMSPAAKDALFGASGKTRQAVEDIVTLSSKGATADKFANTSNTGRATITAAAGAGFVTNPVGTLASALGADMLGRILARPATAQSAANWAKTYNMLIQKPTNASLKALQASSSRFGATIATEFNIPKAANDIGQKLYSTIQSAANDGGGDSSRPSDR